MTREMHLGVSVQVLKVDAKAPAVDHSAQIRRRMSRPMLLRQKSIPLPPSAGKEALCYMSTAQASVCGAHGMADLKFRLPCWVPQARVSGALFGEKGSALVAVCEKEKGPFMWATEFSNVHETFAFDEPPITIDGVEFGGPEQFFQLMKSSGTESHAAAAAAMAMASPFQAYAIGRTHQMRDDWEDVKVDFMRQAVEAKFRNPSLRALLLSTQDFPLLQLKPSENFWGSGADGTGRNVLGALLMELRQKLRD
jgi:ribA/ribD-fused uncharacterized protein